MWLLFVLIIWVNHSGWTDRTLCGESITDQDWEKLDPLICRYFNKLWMTNTYSDLIFYSNERLCLPRVLLNSNDKTALTKTTEKKENQRDDKQKKMDKIYLNSCDGRVFTLDNESPFYKPLVVSQNKCRVKILSTFNLGFWCILENFEVALFIPKPDAPIRYQVCTFENQVGLLIHLTLELFQLK